MDLISLLTEIRQFGFERAFRRFPGLYRANVADVRDPEKRGRIRALVPVIGTREASTNWFEPAGGPQAGANRGAFYPPSMGDSVFVAFENGDPSRPLLYIGGWYGNPSSTSEVPAELGYDSASPPQPRRSGYVSRTGHALIFNETPDAEEVELRWHQMAAGDAARTDLSKTGDRAQGKTSRLRFERDGTVRVTSSSGAEVSLEADAKTLTVKDQSGNSIVFTTGGIRVKAKGGTPVTVEADAVNLKASTVTLGDPASFRAVLGEKLKAWLLAHTHGTGTGPSSTPLVPPPDDILSTTVKLKG